MYYTLTTVALCFQSITIANGNACQKKCDVVTTSSEMACGFDVKGSRYKMFPSRCALEAYKECYQVDLKQTALKFCIKEHSRSLRRMSEESCPLFCPSHYRPVCAAARLRSYNYRTFNNGCYLDMVNCHGDEDYTGYVEVPLEYCQRHLMKNIFKEQVVISNQRGFDDY